MNEPIYFTKILFRELCLGERRILIDLPNKELSYGAYKSVKNSIAGFERHEENEHIVVPCKIINNCKTDFKNEIVYDSCYKTKEVFLKGFKLSSKIMNELMPLCNALEFEQYRDKEPSMTDPGYIGYRDESILIFEGITDSCLPLNRIFMSYYYDKKHIPPTEKLYRYICKNILERDKECSEWMWKYGSFSLFF